MSKTKFSFCNISLKDLIILQVISASKKNKLLIDFDLKINLNCCLYSIKAFLLYPSFHSGLNDKFNSLLEAAWLQKFDTFWT